MLLKQFPRGRIMLATLALLTTALVVACSDNGSGDGNDSPDPTTTVTTPPSTNTSSQPPAQPDNGSPSRDLDGTVQIDGSSTVHPITEGMAEEFASAQPNVQVPVGVSGTGGGFSRFCAGETDISNASRPIRTGADTESADCEAAGIEYIEIPVAYDGLSVVVHPENDWVSCITVDELNAMWAPEAEGVVMNWSDVNPAWPNEPLELYAPGTDSGTFDYFTEAINGDGGASRADFTPSEDDNVLVQGIAGSPYAIGYFGLAYLEANEGAIVGLEVDSGSGCVAPTRETVESGEYAPLSRPLFIYVNVESAERPEVQAFVDFYLENAATLSADVGYVPFPQEFYDVIVERWENREAGSIFSGAEGSVGDILGVN